MTQSKRQSFCAGVGLATLLILAIVQPLRGAAIRVWHDHGFKSGTIGEFDAEGSQIRYSETGDTTQNFTISCSDFLKRAALGTNDWLSITVGDRSFTFYGFEHPNRGDVIYKPLLDGCAKARIRSGSLDVPVERSYKVGGGKMAGTIRVQDVTVHYASAKDPSTKFDLSCAEFRDVVKVGYELRIEINQVKYEVRPTEKGLDPGRLYNGITEVCESGSQRQEAKQADQRKRDGELRAAEEQRAREARREDETRRQAEERARETELRASTRTRFADEILKLWAAAGEKEPFASIRGEYDLRSADGRWKATLQLLDASDCFVGKSNAGSVKESSWIFSCKYTDSSPENLMRYLDDSADVYERLAKAVQSVLGLAYQPDDAAIVAKVNQVFFRDQSKG